MAMLKIPTPTNFEEQGLLRTSSYPRIRYMGSKYKVIPHLAAIFSQLEFQSVLDAFSGSGVVSYALKEMGKEVTSNDFLAFSSTIARAVVANDEERLNEDDVARLLGPNRDGRSFVAKTFQGLYFPQEDHEFIDRIWSNLGGLSAAKRDLAIAALCLSAARKQPRGVFTITDVRYDDGRRSMRMPLSELFLEAVAEYNAALFDNGRHHTVTNTDVLEYEKTDFDLVYFDPPYAPPKDDADYVKRYHFLEGLSVYWEGLPIMEHTKTKKIHKKHTPFAHKRKNAEALLRLFQKFKNSTIILSYSSNSVPGEKEIVSLLRQVKRDVQIYSVPHTYSFGTHDSATRRRVEEYIFVAR